MTLISSEWTLVNKRVLPVLFVLFFVVVLVAGFSKSSGPGIEFFAAPFWLGIFYLVYRFMIFDLADEVWDVGDALLVKRRGMEERITLANISNVNGPSMSNPPRVTLTLRSPNRFGGSITFMPKGGRGIFFMGNSMIKELITRIDQARCEPLLIAPAATLGESAVAVDLSALPATIAATRAHLLSLRNAAGHWEGELSSSALSTTTAIVALTLVDQPTHKTRIAHGVRWLIENQNADGGWGDTTISKTNLSTTLLCWSALSLRTDNSPRHAITRAEQWIIAHVGSLEPDALAKAVVARYGKDKTFSVPILMTCAIGGKLGTEKEAWRRVLPLPFELAALPREWFGAVGLPVVSYALPALIAIGYARFFHARPAWWNPLGWLRGILWPRISPMLKSLQPSTGGYLEATPLTSFVTMALASADEKHHPCVLAAVEFLEHSQRTDGAWPIDTNLATWATTLSVKALYGSHEGSADTLVRTEADRSVRAPLKTWLLSQQYRVTHPFTNAAPGAWAWTDLPGGVPDADDTSSALIALWHLCDSDDERVQILPSIEAGITWLLNLQNRDGGMPTFCRGWGALPFDRSTPEITAHALWAWAIWKPFVHSSLTARLDPAIRHALVSLEKSQRVEGSWIPLWFGNEHAVEEENPVHGTAFVLLSLTHLHGYDTTVAPMLRNALQFLLNAQHPDGGWGGASGVTPALEETANATSALAAALHEGLAPPSTREAIQRGVSWLCQATQNGTVFPSAPIGLYFARLWYHEKTYPVLWTLSALQRAAVISS